MEPSESQAWVEWVNQHWVGFDQWMGIELTEATETRVAGRLKISDCHRQVHGIVHGGVYSGIVETFGSLGAMLSCRSRNCTAVGLENHTSFLRAARDGVLSIVAEPLVAGRRTQVWEVNITDEEGRLVASGRLRALCLESGTEVAGGPATQWGQHEAPSHLK